MTGEEITAVLALLPGEARDRAWEDFKSRTTSQGYTATIPPEVHDLCRAMFDAGYVAAISAVSSILSGGQAGRKP